MWYCITYDMLTLIYSKYYFEERADMSRQYITLRGSSSISTLKKTQRLSWKSSPHADSPNIRCDLYFTHLLTVPSPLDILLSFFWMRNTSSSALIVGNLHVPQSHKIGYKQARETDKQNFRRRYKPQSLTRQWPGTTRWRTRIRMRVSRSANGILCWELFVYSRRRCDWS